MRDHPRRRYRATNNLGWSGPQRMRLRAARRDLLTALAGHVALLEHQVPAPPFGAWVLYAFRLGASGAGDLPDVAPDGSRWGIAVHLEWH